MTAAQRTALKDDRLAGLADRQNVAQFFSVAEDGSVRHVRFASPSAARDVPGLAAELLAGSAAHRVNVRTFRRDSQKSMPFHYGLAAVEQVVDVVRASNADGLVCIVNELVDVSDGGVSGVALGDVVEFAPDDTPRAVEGPGALALRLEDADRLLQAVYGPDVVVPADPGARVEFSVHPLRVGLRRTRVLVWETEPARLLGGTPRTVWPNRFSRHVGDKTFGLLAAWLAGLDVPRTTLYGRSVAPFTFGRPTGSGEVWMRTCPREAVPGHFTTRRGWTDPYELMREDPDGVLAGLLVQDGVDASFSGASMPRRHAPDLVEGVEGFGDGFMLGELAPQDLPTDVVAEVRAAAGAVAGRYGPVRLEWAHDGDRLWVLQMHQVKELASDGDDEVVPGDAAEWLRHDVRDGLEALRGLVRLAADSGSGIVVHGRVGLTSHVGDVLRKAGVPSRLVRSYSSAPGGSCRVPVLARTTLARDDTHRGAGACARVGALLAAPRMHAETWPRT